MKRRIVFIQAGLGAGGAEKNIARLAIHRAERGDDVHVIAMTGPANGGYFSFPDTVAIHVFERESQRRRRLASLRRLFFIRKTLRRIEPDIVVSFLTKLNVLTLLGNLDARWPIIVSERNNPDLQKAHVLWKHLNTALSRRASAIVMLTQRAADRLPPKLKRLVEVIPNPCAPPREFRFQPRRAKRVIAVGRLDYQKGFDLLLPAFGQVVESHPDATLTIFGEGQERTALEAMVSDLGLQGSVRLPGTTERPGAWIEQGDILVQASRYEGFPNVLLEGVASGMPTIATNCDFGPDEVITHLHNGILVPTGDIHALAQAITALLADEALQDRLSQNARIASDCFSEARVLSQWDALIDRLTPR